MEPIATKSIGVDGDVFEERRREIRRRVFKGAKLVFNNGYGSVECVVRNQSDHGARLRLGDSIAAPSRFEVHIAGDGAPRPARACWRTQTEIGIAFIG